MKLSNLTDKAIEAAMVAIPGALWIKALTELVGDLNGASPLVALERFTEAALATGLAWLMYHYLRVLEEANVPPAEAKSANSAPPADVSRYADLRWQPATMAQRFMRAC
jgi:hypothetical protein